MSILARPPNRSRVHKINVKYEQTLRILTGLKHLLRIYGPSVPIWNDSLLQIITDITIKGRRSKKNRNNAFVYLTLSGIVLPWRFNKCIREDGMHIVHLNEAADAAIALLKADWAMELKEAGVQ